MLLDLHEVDRVAEAGGLEQVLGVGVQGRHLAELVAVATEMTVVDRVEPDERREQPYVGFRDGVAHEVALAGQPRLEGIQPVEETVVCLVIGTLRAGEPGTVHAVVDVAEDDVIDLVDLRTQLHRVEVRCPVAVQRGPLDLEIDRDLRVVVRDDLPARDLDDRRDGDAAGILGEPREVRLLKALDLEGGVEAAGIEVEGPAALVVSRTGHPETDGLLEAEQATHDRRAVGPRARPRRNEPIPAGLDGPAVAPVGGDAVLDVRRVSSELRSRDHVGALRGRGIFAHSASLGSHY